jgi:hypothetical protein
MVIWRISSCPTTIPTLFHSSYSAAPEPYDRRGAAAWFRLVQGWSDSPRITDSPRCPLRWPRSIAKQRAAERVRSP